MKKLLLILAIMALAASANAQLVITGIYDGPLQGGGPRGCELFACDAIPDLSIYGLGSANDGGGSDGEEFIFDDDAVAGGTFIYVTNDAVRFQNWFGFAADYTTGVMDIDGSDAVELFRLGSVFDTFGDIDTNGSGTAWDYTDGWAKRLSGTGPDGSAFEIIGWSFSGPNALDGESSNATASTPFPLGNFLCDPAVDTEGAIWGAVKSLYR